MTIDQLQNTFCQAEIQRILPMLASGSGSPKVLSLNGLVGSAYSMLAAKVTDGGATPHLFILSSKDRAAFFFNDPYIKEPGEDLRSILQGITQKKGRIHIAVTPTITREELDNCARQEKNARYSALAQIINQRIRNGYQLWPNNFIAYDLLHHCNRFADRYNPEECNRFIDYMRQGLQQLQGDGDELRNIFLGRRPPTPSL